MQCEFRMGCIILVLYTPLSTCLQHLFERNTLAVVKTAGASLFIEILCAPRIELIVYYSV